MKTLIAHLIIILSIGQAFGQIPDRVELIEYSQSTCDRTSDPYRLKPRIISIEHNSDTLAIDVGFAATCCLEYLPNIKYVSDTLYISYRAKDEGEACACICCYSFNHKIKGINRTNLTVKLFDRVIELSNEKYWTYEPVFTIIEGDTLNRKDKYGLRQGIWTDPKAKFSKQIEGSYKVDKFGNHNREKKKGSKYSVSFQRYKDDRLDTWGHLYMNLVVKDECDPRTKTTREYYENGQIKKECHETDGKEMECRQWKTNGVEITEN